MEKRFPGIKIKFAIDGKEADAVIPPGRDPFPKVDFMFVALGMCKQEKFLRDRDDIFKVGLGVGGSFNEIIGLERPAPQIVKTLGLKWAWRLFWEPKRFKRIVNAVIIFPWLILKNRLIPKN